MLLWSSCKIKDRGACAHQYTYYVYSDCLLKRYGLSPAADRDALPNGSYQHLHFGSYLALNIFARSIHAKDTSSHSRFQSTPRRWWVRLLHLNSATGFLASQRFNAEF